MTKASDEHAEEVEPMEEARGNSQYRQAKSLSGLLMKRRALPRALVLDFGPDI